MIGGYYDEMLNEFLGIDGLTESVLNVIVIGIGSPSDFISEKFIKLEDVFLYLKNENT